MPPRPRKPAVERPAEVEPSPRWRWPQFRLGAMLFTSVLLCLTFAVLSGLLRTTRSGDGGSQLPVFVLLAVAAPLGVMIALALFTGVRSAWLRWRKDRWQ